MHIERKLEERGVVLPPEVTGFPAGSTPPNWIRVRNGIAYLSGQSARNPDGTSAGPFGKVPSEVSIEDAREKLSYDLWYIRERSLWLDLRIILATVGVVLRQAGAR